MNGCNAFFYSFVIVQDGRSPPGIFQIYVFGNGIGFNGTSTSNSIAANVIQIGQELIGNLGAFAYAADFVTNLWATQPLGQEFVFWYQTQLTDGQGNDCRNFAFGSVSVCVESDNPPFAGWNSVPQFSPFLGGDFLTYCCE